MQTTLIDCSRMSIKTAMGAAGLERPLMNKRFRQDSSAHLSVSPEHHIEGLRISHADGRNQNQG